MTREEIHQLDQLDRAVEELADGRYTLPNADKPHYNIRAILAKTKELGRSLTVEEAEEFIIA